MAAKFFRITDVREILSMQELKKKRCLLTLTFSTDHSVHDSLRRQVLPGYFH